MRLSQHVFLSSRSAGVILMSILLILILLLLNIPALAQPDRPVARVLGPDWQQLSRRAGMIFAGTVVTGPTQSPGTDRGISSVEVSLKVDRAIAGVEPGQVVTIHEWTGALSGHPAMRPGEHLLLFLYPPSRLGLTSPVGGSQGLIRLDSLGAIVIDRSAVDPRNPATSAAISSSATRHTLSRPTTLDELERAIRGARGE